MSRPLAFLGACRVPRVARKITRPGFAPTFRKSGEKWGHPAADTSLPKEDCSCGTTGFPSD